MMCNVSVISRQIGRPLRDGKGRLALFQHIRDPFQRDHLTFGHVHLFALIGLNCLVVLLNTLAARNPHRDQETQKGDHDRECDGEEDVRVHSSDASSSSSSA
jgi:hypothetical protein